MKRVLIALGGLALALLLAVAGGWMWGAAGRREAESALNASGARLHASMARAHLLEARVHLFEVNFGSAARSLEAARADLGTIAPLIERERGADAAASVLKALELVTEAQRLTGQLDQSANAKVAEAIRLLDGR